MIKITNKEGKKHACLYRIEISCGLPGISSLRNEIRAGVLEKKHINLIML
jgi:hypothetical protein